MTRVQKISETENVDLLFRMNDAPSFPQAVVAALSHCGAIVASILTAPLLICGALGLNTLDTRYVLSASLVVSGLATFIQVYRFGRLGCGMIAVQGTSFAFVGPISYLAALSSTANLGDAMLVGKILGTCIACGVAMMLASLFLETLQKIITPTVTGTAIFLLGFTLFESALKNLWAVFIEVGGNKNLSIVAECTVTIVAILLLMRSKQAVIRAASIPLGLLTGTLISLFLRDVAVEQTDITDSIFLLEPLYFSIHFDLLIFALLLPVFLVSLMESIGDLTATSMVSNEPISGPVYVSRIRGGVLADGFNTALAGFFGTFPNTTFSQNNAVIRVTGNASRRVGIFLAFMLIALGSAPQISHLFTLIPGGTLHSTTGLMFLLITFTGFKIIKNNDHGKSLFVLGISFTVAILVREATQSIAFFHDFIPEYLIVLLGFPVATGAIFAILLDLKMR